MEQWEYHVADNTMIGSKDTETEQSDECDRDKNLLSTAPTEKTRATALSSSPLGSVHPIYI